MIIDGEIVHDIFYPHPVERVWRALTEPAELAAWLMPNNFQAEPGHRFLLEAPLHIGEFECEVLEVDPPRQLSYTWRGGPLEHTVVSWLLTPQDGGTRLQLRHNGFQEDSPAEVTMRRDFDSGWDSLKLPGLARVLDEPEFADRAYVRPDGIYEHPNTAR